MKELDNQIDSFLSEADTELPRNIGAATYYVLRAILLKLCSIEELLERGRGDMKDAQIDSKATES